MADINKILLALKDFFNVKTDQQLAGKLGVSKNTVYTWTRRGKIGDARSIVRANPFLSFDWLETGEGPMVIIDKNNIDSLPSNWSANYKEESRSKIAATIEPGPNRKKELQSINERRSEKMEDDGDSIGDLIAKTAKVLESNTIYRTALASNVRAFHQAVEQEEEMGEIKKELEAVNARLGSLERLILKMSNSNTVVHKDFVKKREGSEG